MMRVCMCGWIPAGLRTDHLPPPSPPPPPSSLSSPTSLRPLQYMFGSDLLVAPVTQPMDTTTQMVTKEIWIPEVRVGVAVGGAKLTVPHPLPQGTYISWFSGELIKGPAVVKRTFTLWEMPLFAKEGSIIAIDRKSVV